VKTENKILPLYAISFLLFATHGQANDDIEKVRYRWEQSRHGAMLERILPAALAPSQLPEPRSDGARLAATYCIQCHYLPNPAMHNATKWKSVVERMVWRMEGNGNLGTLMQDMMAGVRAPDADERLRLTRYLQKYAQKEIDPKKYPDLDSQSGKIFSIACSQCHVLPDPRRHSAKEWPGVVERMQRNMAWANRITGDPALKTSPELNTAEIIRFLQRHSR
jgi:hypothetical protein